MKKHFLILFLGVTFCVAFCSCNGNALENPDVQINGKIAVIRLREAGTLKDILKDNDEIYGITDLTVTGNVNVSDLNRIASLGGAGRFGNLSVVDLSESRLVAGKYDGSMSDSLISGFESSTKITSLRLPKGLKYILPEAFAFSGVYNKYRFSGGEEVFYVGEYLIESSKRIVSCKVKEGTRLIAERAFEERDSLQEVSLPAGLFGIGKAAFKNCRVLKELSISSGLIEIGAEAFYHCDALKEISLPKGTERVGDKAFMFCEKLGKVILPDVSELGEWAFYRCPVTNVTLSDELKVIKNHTFEHCSRLKSLRLPNKLVHIGEYAFYESGLTEITLPQGLETIERGAFRSCDLERIYSKIVVPFPLPKSEHYDYCDIFDKSIQNKGWLYVPSGTVELYKSVEGWKYFANIKEM